MFEFQEEADELLQSVIPYLKNFSYLSGGEGVVYFIDDNFVVKKYFQKFTNSRYAQQCLINHCAEVNRLNFQGYPLPKIYSIALPDENNKSVYILEERAKGKSLFPIIKFSQITEQIERKKKARLQFELISKFESDYLKVNEQMEALPDSEIEKFILTDYLMTKNFVYGGPDVVSSNVIFDGKHLSHIDSYFSTKKERGEISDTPSEDVMKDMLGLMFHNGLAKVYLKKACGEIFGVDKILKENTKLTKETLKDLSGKQTNCSIQDFRTNTRMIFWLDSFSKP